MFIFDILIYVFFAWVMYAYAKHSYVFAKRTGRFEQPDKNLWIFWLFFAFICGIRWNVGVDMARNCVANKQITATLYRRHGVGRFFATLFLNKVTKSLSIHIGLYANSTVWWMLLFRLL